LVWGLDEVYRALSRRRAASTRELSSETR
jgi:hypothetical protein